MEKSLWIFFSSVHLHFTIDLAGNLVGIPEIVEMIIDSVHLDDKTGGNDSFIVLKNAQLMSLDKQAFLFEDLVVFFDEIIAVTIGDPKFN